MLSNRSERKFSVDEETKVSELSVEKKLYIYIVTGKNKCLRESSFFKRNSVRGRVVRCWHIR